MSSAARPANSRRTSGYHRAGILIALVNSTTLALIAGGIFYEAYHRLVAPPQVDAQILTVVAAVAFAVNLGTALLVRHGSEHDLNMRSAFVHLAGDAASICAAILAGIGIALTGWQWLDPFVSILIGALILWNAWSITQSMRSLSAHIATDDVPISASVPVRCEISELLFHKYRIAHATLQFECAGCQLDLLYCDLETANHHTHH